MSWSLATVRVRDLSRPAKYNLPIRENVPLGPAVQARQHPNAFFASNLSMMPCRERSPRAVKSDGRTWLVQRALDLAEIIGQPIIKLQNSSM
jgi:hypothetical protein